MPRITPKPIRTLHIQDFVRPDQHYHWQDTKIGPATGYPAHTHDFHELFWIEEGLGHHWINGEERRMNPGALTFIRAPDQHTVCGSGNPVRIVNIAFRVQTWEFLRRRYFKTQADPFGKSHISMREFLFPPADFTELRRMGRELGPQPRERLRIERFLINLISTVQGLRPASSPETSPEWLRRACREIAEGRNFERGTQAMAELAGKTPEHVAREARRWLGKTPTEIVNDARLAYAASRLATTDERIIDIALDCGFENLGHFYKLVQKKFGTSPRQYRLQQQRIVRPV